MLLGAECLTRAAPSFTRPPTRPSLPRAQLETALQWRNYEVKLRLLLHLEELQMEHDIRHYDLESVPMTWDPVDQNPRLLTLEVRARIWHGEEGWALVSQPIGRSCPQRAQQGAEWASCAQNRCQQVMGRTWFLV